MPRTITRIVLDGGGNIDSTIHPDWDAQLQGMTIPDGHVAVDVPNEEYDACRSELDKLVMVQSYIPGNAMVIRSKVSAKIKAINDEAASAVEVAQAEMAAFEVPKGQGGRRVMDLEV